MNKKEERRFYVYIWFIKDSGEVFYVGKGSGKRCDELKGRNVFFMDMYKTHSCESKIIYADLNEKEAFEKEIETIRYYREEFPGFRLTNQTNGGEGVSGWIATEEYRQFFKIRNTGSGNPNFGNKWTEEQKDRASKNRSGIYKGKSNPKSKRILCIETGEIFEYIMESSEKYKTKNSSSFSIALNKKNKTASGLHWITIKEEKDILSKEERWIYFLECLLSERSVYFIDAETKEILDKRSIRERLRVSFKTIDKILFQYGELKYNGSTYVPLKDYYSRLIQ